MSVGAASLKKKDAIVDGTVTGVQTCALPISGRRQGDHHSLGGRNQCRRQSLPVLCRVDRKSGVEGKRGDVGGGRIIKKKRRHSRWNCDWSSDVCSSDLWKAARGPSFPRRKEPVSAAKPSRLMSRRSEERRGGKEGRCRWGPHH